MGDFHTQPDTNDGLTSIDRVRLALAMMDTGSSWDLEPEYAEDLLTAYDALRARVDELTGLARFLLDRLQEFDPGDFEAERDFHDHVAPAIARLTSAISLERSGGAT